MNATQNPIPEPAGTTPVTRRVDGRPESDADRRFFDLRESGYLGPIDQDGSAVADPVWYERCAVCDVEFPYRGSPDPLCGTCQWQADGNDMPDDTTPARVLRDAALYLDRHGWIQGAYYDATGGSFTPPACMVGAIGMVCYGGPVDAPALNYDDPGFASFAAARDWLDGYLCASLAYDIDAYGYNDHTGRTADQVLGILHGAAVAWDYTHGGAE